MEYQDYNLSNTLNDLRQVDFSKYDQREQLYHFELLSIIENTSNASTISNIFMELTYLLARYLGPNYEYTEVSPFLTDNSSPITYYITSIRYAYAMHLCRCLDISINVSKDMLESTENLQGIIQKDLLFLLDNQKLNYEDTNELIDQGSSSLYIFADYLRKAIPHIKSLNLQEIDKNFFLAVSIYFGFYRKDHDTLWMQVSGVMPKLLEKYCEDYKSDGYLDMIGPEIYTFFKFNEQMQRKYLRDINMWIMANYSHRLEQFNESFSEVKDTIDREEFSIARKNECENALKEAVNIYSAFIYHNWPASAINIKLAEKIIIMYKWASFKLMELKD
ncbi:unnamed protein product [Blepharisma stoltei]|uniref:Terpene synthase n=1 Tax=Blepharisma stoltei TaxID=1481888 RepID=A0AAU9JUQ9_9CILI|nr:unnamed protein product [Blepharisma stoltei]